MILLLASLERGGRNTGRQKIYRRKHCREISDVSIERYTLGNDSSIHKK
jgi:hypothetical protein